MPTKKEKPDRHEGEEKGKLFVGGLSWETTQETLQRFFSQFGDVIDCVVMKNNETGRSRGFGFVTFSDPNHVDLVIENGPHTLDGRTIDPKPCNPRSMQKPKRNANFPKVFLGGLPSNITETDLRTYFSRYGKVMEVVIMYDQERKKSRGFGFLSFESDESVERIVSEHYININGKQVEIKRAEPRDANKMGNDGMSGGGQWGPSSGGPPMGMGGGMGPMGPPNNQMGGPMGHMGPPGGMMQGYQGWAGYGPPQGPQGYQGWGAPPGPHGQQMPPQQWGGSYGGPHNQGYGGPQPGYGGSWNWNMPQNGPAATSANQGPPAGTGPQGDMYNRQPPPPGAGPASGPSPPGGPAGPAGQKAGSDYSSFPNQYANYQQDSSYGPGNRGYGQDGTGNQSGYSHPPPVGPPDYGYNSSGNYAGGDNASSGSYAGGPGPQRGGNYSQPNQSTGFHPYRRMP